MLLATRPTSHSCGFMVVVPSEFDEVIGGVGVSWLTIVGDGAGFDWLKMGVNDGRTGIDCFGCVCGVRCFDSAWVDVLNCVFSIAGNGSRPPSRVVLSHQGQALK
jgi:hypothetical protein